MAMHDSKLRLGLASFLLAGTGDVDAQVSRVWRGEPAAGRIGQ